MAANNQHYKLSNPQVVAWTVLIISFALFCTVCAAGTAGARWFVFESQIDMTVTLTVSRGRVDMQLPDGQGVSISRQDTVPSGAILQVDSASQGYLTFEDTYSKQVVATVFLLADSKIVLDQGTRPRFDWSSTAYNIGLNGALGRFVVEVGERLGRPVAIDVGSALGSARFLDKGAYRLEISDSQMHLIPGGNGALFRLASGEEKPVPPGNWGTLIVNTMGVQETFVRQVLYDVLNADFGSADDISANPALPIGWGCTSEANRQREPQGTIARILYDQQVSIRMLRQGERLDHAESRCIYTFEAIPRLASGIENQTSALVPSSGLDVTGYLSLIVSAKIRILSQDVTTCGIAGSECPVMLELEYLGSGNPPDQTQFWRHGFYGVRPTNDSNPLSCDTCLQEHERLNVDTWYIYESGDLFKLLPGSKRPTQLIRFKVYASGHAYDAIVTNLSITAGKAFGE